MSEKMNQLIMESVPNQEAMNELLGNLFETAQPTAVFSQPVTQGEYTVITASEATAVFGAGYGGGAGIGEAGDGEETAPNGGYGGGGGGGGTAMSRPVAAITIGPNGVHVEPIMDPTKIAIAMFTALGAVFMSLAKMRRFARTKKMS